MRFLVPLVTIGWFASFLPAEEFPSASALLKEFDADKDRKLDRQELTKALAQLSGEGEENFSFIRVRRNKRGNPIALETSTASYESEDGKIRVDLIGAVHVADRRYFTDLNKQFEEYDVVLYELVAPEGTRIPKGGARSQHPVGRMQEGIKSMLDLSFQLNHIDYQKTNLVHADMSPEEFAKSMKDRGESFLQILFRMMGHAAAQSAKGQTSDAQLLLALFSPKRSLKLKQILADQFENLEGQMSVFEGPNGSTLISERNKKALSILQKQLDAGKTRIGIFYGAGHLHDMSKRLKRDFGLKPKAEKWTLAWDMSS